MQSVVSFRTGANKSDNIYMAFYSLLSTLSYIISYDFYFLHQPYEVVTAGILPPCIIIESSSS